MRKALFGGFVSSALSRYVDQLCVLWLFFFVVVVVVLRGVHFAN